MTTTQPAADQRRSLPGGREHLLRRLLRRPLGVISAAYLAIVAIVALVGRWISPYNPNRASLELVLAPPSPAHPLGADSSGFDVLSRLLYATQTSIAAALVALIVALVVGVIAGLVAGYFRGWFDSVATWVTSLTMALPGMVVLLAASAAFGPSVWIAMLIFGILLSPSYYRLVYAAVNAVRNELYIDAARVSGISDPRIIARHILPVVRAPIVIQSAIIMGIAIAVQAGLGFLGLGDPTVPTWGEMLIEAFTNIYNNPLLMVWPSLAVGLTCIALTLLANALRDDLERTSRVRRRRSKRSAALHMFGPVTATTGLATSFDARSSSQIIRHPDDAVTASVTRPSLLAIRDLQVGYDQADGSALTVVHSVSLDVRRGEVHGLIGESGSGKTQTALAVLGLLPKGGRTMGGTIVFDGASLHDANEPQFGRLRGRRLGYIPQEPMSNLDPSFKVGSQLIEPLRVVQGLSRKDATEKCLALLERVGIKEPRRAFDAYPFEISGGMAQRVLIAGAVSMDPDLIVADEPTTALDVSVQAEVLDLLRELQQEREMAMLLVTHNFGVVADLCDRVTVMKEGLSVESGPVRTILERPSHPYTQSLLNAILEGGPARNELGASATMGRS